MTFQIRRKYDGAIVGDKGGYSTRGQALDAADQIVECSYRGELTMYDLEIVDEDADASQRRRKATP